MANRNKNYDKLLAQKFENPEYAKSYLINIVEQEKLPLDEALIETIQAMGLKRFSEKAKLSLQSVSDFVNKRQKWSAEKLAKHISEVFHLKVKLTIENPDSGEVA